MSHPTAHIIAIGSELLHGGRVDSNSLFIVEGLAQAGVQVRQKISLGDDLKEIKAVLSRSAKQVDVIVTTGGLGSTLDDCTREAVGQAFNRTLKLRPKALQALTILMRSRKREVTPLIRRQAMIPMGATLMPNGVGTAPGFFLRESRALIFALPGVPREAKDMMQCQVQPLLQGRIRHARVYWSYSFNTFGLPETDVQTIVWPVVKETPAIEVSFLASTKGVKVTLSSWLARISEGGREGWKRNFLQGEKLIEEVRKSLSPWLYSEGEEGLEEVVGRLLTGRGWTIAVAESCTGGLIAHRLTEVPGSSLYLDRGIVSYSNRAKERLLGVSPILLNKYGAVSLPVAQAMADGARRTSGVDLGIGITGIAGPGGGTKVKPVGTVCMAIAGPFGRLTKQFQFWGDRTEIKFRSSQAALDLIRRYVQGLLP